MPATTYDQRGATAWITLDSPETRNALSIPLMAELIEHLRTALADDSVRSIVLTGKGRAFCAGADLKSGGLKNESPSGEDNPLVRVMKLIIDGNKPVICAVNGAAFGGGIGLIAAADIAIAVEGAKLSFSEVRIGLIPAIISVVVLPKLGSHQTARLFLTGERFDAARALEYGLLHRVVAAAELTQAVQQELDAIHLGGPRAIAEVKKLVRMVSALPRDQAFDHAAKASVALFGSAEGAEGMAAFAAKRAPRWVSELD